MTEIDWKTGTSGNWGTASNWDDNAVPNSTTADVAIEVAGTYTVTLATAASYTVDSVTLDNSSAKFDLFGTLILGGKLASLIDDAGTVILGSNGKLNGGTLDIGGAGLFESVGNGNLPNTITGSVVSSGTILVTGGSLALAGGSNLNGTLGGGGTVIFDGANNTFGSDGSIFWIENNTTLDDFGTITELGPIYVTGSDSLTLNIEANAVYDAAGGLNFIDNINLGADYSTIDNAGLLESTDTGFEVENLFINTGTVLAEAGNFVTFLDGTFGGTFEGAGEIYIGYAAILAPNFVNDVATLALYGNETLNSNLDFTQLVAIEERAVHLNGYDLTLAGTSALDAGIDGNGTVMITGTDMIGGLSYSDSGGQSPVVAAAGGSPAIVSNNATQVDAGTIIQDGFLILGAGSATDTSSLVIKAGAIYDIADVGTQINVSGIPGLIANAGLFEATAPAGELYTASNSGLVDIYASFVNSGTVLTTLGVDLSFHGGVQNNAGMIVSGGTLAFDNGITGTGTIDIETAGDVIVSGSVSAGQTFNLDGIGTLQLSSPTLFGPNGHGSLTATINELRAGDVLELPGTAVSAVSFGTNSLSVTTSSGIYDFTDVTYADVINGYTVTNDPNNSAEQVITFIDTFVSTPIIIASGKTINYATIGSGGSQFVATGGTANVATLSAGGVQEILAGGTANHTVIYGGVMGVAGTANRIQVNAGGVEIIQPGGQSAGTSILQGGYEYVLGGGTAIDTTIAYLGTLLLIGGTTSGSIDFGGSDAVLSVGGTVLPDTVISGFNQRNTHDDAVILTGFTYAAGQDTATLGAGGVLTLNLAGKIEKLNFDPSQSNAGHSFAVTTNSLDQVVVIDPAIGVTPKMTFLSAATAAGSSNIVTQITGRSAALLMNVSNTGSLSTGFQTPLINFAAISQLDTPGSAGSNVAALNLHSSILPLANKFEGHSG